MNFARTAPPVMWLKDRPHRLGSSGLLGSLGLLGLAALLLACSGEEGPVIDIAIITAAGESPLPGHDQIAVTVRQGPDGEVLVSEGAVSETGFDVRVEIADYQSPVDLSVVLTGPSQRSIGGAPTFLPGETGRIGDPQGLVVVAVGTPMTCEIIADMTLEDSRSALGFTAQGTFGAALGGYDAAGPSTTASFVDLMRLGLTDDPESTGRLTELPWPLGRTRTFAYSRSRALVLSELQRPFVYDLSANCDTSGDPPPGGCPIQNVPANLHLSAGDDSAALEVSDAVEGGGVVVVGGDDSADVSWIARDGQTFGTRLTTPRVRPRLIELQGGAVLVVGGELGGAYAEVVRRGEPVGQPIADPRVDGIVRVGGALFADPTGQGALLVGGVTPDERLIPETELFTGCPNNCRIVAGPPFTGARFDPTFVPAAKGGGLVVGGGDPPVATVDRVVWADPVTPRFDTHGPLTAPRRDAAAIALDNGVIFVAGGIGDAGPRLDLEMCFPEAVELP